MKTNEQRKIEPEGLFGPGLVRAAPLWPVVNVESDNLSSARPLREPHFSDGDLLHGEES